MDPINIAAENVATFVKTVVELHEYLECEIDIFLRALNSFITVADKPKAVARESRLDVKNVIDELKQAVHKYYLFVDNINDFFMYGRDESRMKRINQGIERDDCRELHDFTDRLKRYLAAAERYYEESSTALERVRTTSKKGAEDSRVHSSEAKTKKNVARVVGGTAAAGTIAAGGSVAAAATAGVIVSIAIGVCTGGVGTVVGVTLTAVGSFVGGVALGTSIGAGTHVIASEFKELEKTFNGLTDSFNKVHRSATSVLDKLMTMNDALDAISRNIDDVNYVREHHRVTATLRSEMDRLRERFNACYSQTSKYIEPLKTVEGKLKNLQLYNSLYDH